jgi:hypothetical protein
MKGAANMAKYRVNWLIKGLVPGIKYLNPNEIVDLEPEDAARSLEVGSLSLVVTKGTACGMTDTGNGSGSAPGASAPAGAPDGNQGGEIALDAMNKGQLVKYAQEALGLALDINLSKKNILAAIAEATASK